MKMITQIKSRLFLLLLVLTCAGSALADTTFKITDGVVESQLKDRSTHSERLPTTAKRP